MSRKKCVPCEGGTSPMASGQAAEWAAGLRDFRPTSDGKGLRAEYLMSDFMAAVELIRGAASAAEASDHHPDIHLTGYRRLVFELSTHSIGGLSENDFILAAKIEGLPKSLKR